MWYLIKRGAKPSYHRAPFHPVIICDLKRITKQEAGNTRHKAWVWKHIPSELGSGWLLTRWEGLDVDYWPVITSCILLDGTKTGFTHDRHKEPWTLLAGAVWWSNKKLPSCLAEAGVGYLPDRFSRDVMLDELADDGCSGSMGREWPDFWPTAQDSAIEVDVREAE